MARADGPGPVAAAVRTWKSLTDQPTALGEKPGRKATGSATNPTWKNHGVLAPRKKPKHEVILRFRFFILHSSSEWWKPNYAPYKAAGSHGVQSDAAAGLDGIAPSARGDRSIVEVPYLFEASIKLCHLNDYFSPSLRFPNLGRWPSSESVQLYLITGVEYLDQLLIIACGQLLRLSGYASIHFPSTISRLSVLFRLLLFLPAATFPYR
ncbi:uncharacterized protein L3040_006284 [Drepanopeziza brunnea f. sp. 'multigermtubi']|uniref:uncharacterized protein n=1 Tax=Drepanopeziza brunnea f. sp. 'multigermtubi' TaxID=698441 RepID=UPI002389AF8A|nr:hypothetical protein L3040_006284 [Drepanopeziza brunnea f. sp. 'multigermtubi']